MHKGSEEERTAGWNYNQNGKPAMRNYKINKKKNLPELRPSLARKASFQKIITLLFRKQRFGKKLAGQSPS